MRHRGIVLDNFWEFRAIKKVTTIVMDSSHSERVLSLTEEFRTPQKKQISLPGDVVSSSP
jgi:hypothetical protein